MIFLLVFFLRTRPPPSSTLFPYTTLFRSSHRRYHGGDSAAVSGAEERQGLRRLVADARRCRASRRLGAHQDRKSTRLNSSHQIISYAVFCLKKKNTNNLYTSPLIVYR